MEHPYRGAGRPHLLLGLAPSGVCLAAPVARHAGELLPHRFTLTSATRGGLFSVALSAGRPAWHSHQRPALWSPDFPRPGEAGPRPPDRLPYRSSRRRPHLGEPALQVTPLGGGLFQLEGAFIGLDRVGVPSEPSEEIGARGV
jgi:hypothetical protein